MQSRSDKTVASMILGLVLWSDTMQENEERKQVVLGWLVVVVLEVGKKEEKEDD